jgi:multiple sugar transport system permease protein
VPAIEAIPQARASATPRVDRQKQLRRWFGSDRTLSWLLLAPALIVIAAVFVYPLGYSLWMSLQAYNIITPPRFVGLRNYERILTDDTFWQSTIVTFEFAIPTFILEVVLGFGMALLLEMHTRGRGLMRSIILLPLLLTPVVEALNWRVMLNYDFGVVNWLIGLVGIPKVNWVNDATLALPALVVLEVWRVVGFEVLVFSAGLAALPTEPFESAQIDGASNWQQLIHLTVPMLMPLFVVVALFRSYELLRVFDIVYGLTGGGPGRATETLSFHIFNQMIQGFQVGYASAAAYVLFAMSLVLVLVIIKVLGLGGIEAT